MFILNLTKFGVKKTTQLMLKVTIPEDLSYEAVFDGVFKKFDVNYELKKVRTTELGSLYELVYLITMSTATDQKQFLDAIRVRNGNLDITLTMSPTTTDY
jgi:hypothetical protein